MLNWYKGSDPNKPPDLLSPTDPRAGMMKWFDFGHLPAPLQVASEPFNALAHWMMANLKPGPEATIAMRKLLESKDAGVRAVIEQSALIEEKRPGGEGAAGLSTTTTREETTTKEGTTNR
jgi:hypothetical protein